MLQLQVPRVRASVNLQSPCSERGNGRPGMEKMRGRAWAYGTRTMTGQSIVNPLCVPSKLSNIHRKFVGLERRWDTILENCARKWRGFSASLLVRLVEVMLASALRRGISTSESKSLELQGHFIGLWVRHLLSRQWHGRKGNVRCDFRFCRRRRTGTASLLWILFPLTP